MQIFIIRAFSFDSLKKIVNFGAKIKRDLLKNMEELKKKNRKDEMFLAITESKKIVNGEGEDAQVSFEKHKIFLYKEDFDKFMKGLNEAIGFINKEEMPSTESDMDVEKPDNASEQIPLTPMSQTDEKDMKLDGEIKIDIDFE